MSFKAKPQPFNPAVLPMEYSPRIPDGLQDHTRHYLIPGKIFVAAQPFAISTVVGSSVALCLWDSASKIGGANHFMLPEGPAESENATRYANVANPMLLKRIIDLGAEKKTLQARIFGGSLPSIAFNNETEHLGERNVEAVTRFLNLAGIRVVESEVGGTHGRKVVFCTDDGRAWSEEL